MLSRCWEMLYVNHLFEHQFKEVFADADGRHQYEKECCWVSSAKKELSTGVADVGIVDDSLGYDFSFYAPKSLFVPSSDEAQLTLWKVEVKGLVRNSDILTFHMSHNEFDCAEKNGSQYLIFIVSLKPSPKLLTVIQNLYLLCKQGILTRETQNYNLMLKLSQ